MELKKFLSHLFLLNVLIGICIWDRIVNIPKYPYCFFYMTQIDLYLPIIYFSLITFEDLLYGKSHLSHQLLYNFCFALSFMVFAMFWSLMVYNPHTLYKKGITIPFLLNFSLHGGVFFINLTEQLVINKRKGGEYVKWYVYLIFTFVYTMLLKGLYEFYEIKVYPFAVKSNVMLVGVNACGFGVAMIGHYFYRYLSKKDVSKLPKTYTEKGTELIERK